MIFETTAKRWKDSIRIIFPNKVAEEMNIKPGDRVLINILSATNR
ncbi:MAG: hypothetical protein NT001_05550 [Candidatus Woesearchaeota archaeon]|nr:hypothetical protein [Candidatus Woesearchaeota archaeon]